MSSADIVKLIFQLPEHEQWQVIMRVLKKLQPQTVEQNLAEPGEPLTLEGFKERIYQTEQDILEGNTFSSEEVKERLKKWK